MWRLLSVSHARFETLRAQALMKYRHTAGACRFDAVCTATSISELRGGGLALDQGGEFRSRLRKSARSMDARSAYQLRVFWLRGKLAKYVQVRSVQ
jgi:hypothetical protein